MKAHRYIEVWFSDLVRRDYVFVKDMVEAKRQCKLLSLKGCTGICVDVTYKDVDGDLIESKSKWYSYKEGKLKRI
jgi:hypothetical protein